MSIVSQIFCSLFFGTFLHSLLANLTCVMALCHLSHRSTSQSSSQNHTHCSPLFSLVTWLVEAGRKNHLEVYPSSVQYDQKDGIRKYVVRLRYQRPTLPTALRGLDHQFLRLQIILAKTFLSQ